MTFEDWMRQSKLSESSIKKYDGAIKGIMTDWALEANLISGSLISISSLIQFKEISSSMQGLNIFKTRNDTGHGMYKSALSKYEEYLSLGFNSDIEDDIDSILGSDNLNDTEKKQLIKARIGQGKFRKELISKWQKCSVTGYTDVSFLVASHIKPWSASNNTERLDPFNGLLLVANIDRAFDKGFITFDLNGKIVISEQLKDPEKLGIYDSMSVLLDDKHMSYMDFHRKEVFRNT